MRRVSGVVGLVLAALLLAASGAVRAGAGDGPATPEDDAAATDCGTKALYVLLRWENSPADPERIAAALDAVAGAAAHRGSGHSLRELRDAAGRFGVPLDGVRWPPGTTPPGSMIAFLDRKPHGHFIAVRPVGHTGRLVQVLDGEADPEVIDADRLPRVPGWTGLVLTPHRANRVAWGGGFTLALAVIGWPVTRGWRSRRRVVPAA